MADIISQITNGVDGLLDKVLGKNVNSFYEEFYSAFLTQANSLPINSLWVVFFTSIPPEIETIIKDYENWDNLTPSIQKAKSEAQRKKGILIAQGVKIIGENNNVSRDGFKNTGFIQGLIGNGRGEFPLLKIAFLENNVSFTDYFLRPWQIAVSHKSLKYDALKTDITVWFLTKAGPKKDMIKRKVVTYKKCCPVNIDEQEYNYNGSDVYCLRQVEFAFSTYEMGMVDTTLLTLINPTGLMGSLKTELQRQFGASSPTEYLGNLLGRAKEFASELIRGTAKNIVTNVAGSIQDKVESTITKLESSGRGAATKLTNNINDAVNSALGNSSSSKNNSSSLPSGGINKSVAAQVETVRAIGANNAAFGGYVQKSVKTEDTPLYVKNIEQEQRGKPAEVSVITPINENDAPMHEQSSTRDFKTGNPNDDTVTLTTPLKYFVSKPNPPMNDVRHGEINHQGVEQKIAQNDYVSSLQLNIDGKSINKTDTPDRRSIKYIGKNTDVNDVPSTKSIRYISKTLNESDVPVR